MWTNEEVETKLIRQRRGHSFLDLVVEFGRGASRRLGLIPSSRQAQERGSFTAAVSTTGGANPPPPQPPFFHLQEFQEDLILLITSLLNLRFISIQFSSLAFVLFNNIFV
jgi:hypothetical protein